MSFLLRTGFCLVLFAAFVVQDNLHGQMTYTITGFANNLGDDGNLAPEVSAGESYVAEFVIDESVVDGDPQSNRGLYSSAILSSSISFSGGYVSQADFTGGDVEIFVDDFGGSGVFIITPDRVGVILIADLDTSLGTDALPTNLSDELVGSPFSFFSITEPTGLIVSFSGASDLGLGETQTSGPIRFSVSAFGEPTPTLGDVNMDDIVDFSDIPPFIDVLASGDYQAEADIDQSGAVDFADIPGLIGLLSAQ